MQKFLYDYRYVLGAGDARGPCFRRLSGIRAPLPRTFRVQGIFPTRLAFESRGRSVSLSAAEAWNAIRILRSFSERVCAAQGVLSATKDGTHYVMLRAASRLEFPARLMSSGISIPLRTNEEFVPGLRIAYSGVPFHNMTRTARVKSPSSA